MRLFRLVVPIFFATAIVFTSAAQAFECGKRAVMTSTNADGTQVGVFISEDQMEETPKWSPGDGETPVPLSQAATIAIQWAEARYTRFDGVEIDNIGLYPYGCFQRRDRWYYIFHFSPIIDGGTVYGSGYFAAVLMDGTVIGPKKVGNQEELRDSEIMASAAPDRANSHRLGFFFIVTLFACAIIES